ncbi:MAG: hypothetical protein VXZ96_00075 [Myxococcota bacterium]|nr:hypothetical protein [Myxococcota bacterium]
MIRSHNMFLALVGLLSFEGTAQGQEPVDAAQKERGMTAEEKGFVFDYHVLGFEEQPESGDCDPIHARYGRCIELVDFVDWHPSWWLASRYDTLKPSQQAQLNYWSPDYYENWINSSSTAQNQEMKKGKAHLRGFGELYAQLWEDMAYRWKDDGDAPSELMALNGIKTLPTTAQQWEAISIRPRRQFSVPSSDHWLDQGEVIEMPIPLIPQPAGSTLPELARPKALFPLVKYAIPKNHFVEPTSAIMLKGRFASRLGVKNQLHDYNLMDGDPISSGPFFEQMYPYDTIFAQDDLSFIPLVDFRYPSSVLSSEERLGLSSTLPVNSYQDAALLAGMQFNRFYRLVASQVMQFAMQDYTANHMRILASLTSMRTPPGALADATGITDNLNPGSIGQTDSTAEQESRVNRSAYSVPGGFKLNYAKIPIPLTVEWITRLDEAYKPPPSFYMDTTGLARDMFFDILIPNPDLIQSVSDEGLKQWVQQNKAKGIEPNVLLEPLRRLVLQELMGTLEKEVKDVEETWLLLDHINYAIASNMDVSPEVRISPGDFEGLAAERWESVLGDHYYSTQKISQGLGAIDPTSVCATAERTEALAEPSVGAMVLDQIFVGVDSTLPDFQGEGNQLTSERLLWSARNQIPFFSLDNPEANKASVQRLVGLPDGQALYRARWTIWSGWHLMWGVEQFSGQERLVLRTAAICDDMVLSPPELVPSIVRAGLLHDEFYPTKPARNKDKVGRTDYPNAKERRSFVRRARRNEERQKDRDDVNRDVSNTRRRSVSGVGNALNIRERVKNPTVTSSDVNRFAGADMEDRGLSMTFDKRGDLTKRPLEVSVSDTVDYIRGIVRAPFEEMSLNNGVTVIVLDADEPTSLHRLRDVVGHTPYIKHRQFMGFNQQLDFAGWSLYFDKGPENTQVVLSAPNYTPHDNYAAGAVVPRFKQVRTTDVTFVGDLGMFPVSNATYICDSSVNQDSLAFIDRCEDGQIETVKTDGFSVGFGSYATIWLRNDPRMAAELGLEIKLDALHGGYSFFHSEEAPNLSDVVSGIQDPNQVNNTAEYPNYSWVFRPMTGASAGFRHAPDSMPLQRWLRGVKPWGAPSASGRSKQHRTEWGVRGAFLVYPSYNGMEGVAVADLWEGHALRSKRSDWANFSSYHPIVLGGLYLRYQYAFPLLEDSDEARLYTFDHSHTLLVGWRTQLRNREERPE